MDKQLVEKIVSIFDELYGEHSSKARYLARDIAHAANTTDNKEVEEVFTAVGNEFDYGAGNTY